MEYSLKQLTDEWKMRAGLEPVRIDATLTRYDAFDIDEYIHRMVDDWYLKLLDEGDLQYLDPEDVSSLISVVSLVHGVATIELPPSTRRLVEIKDKAWMRPALITVPGSRLAGMQDSVFSRGRYESPVAVVDSPRTVRLYSYSPGSRPDLERVLALRHTEGVYRLSPRALSTITPQP